jgi:hypothetical protein
VTGEFLRQLDAAILSGLSSSKVARMVGINETTVRRRKGILAAEGHSFQTARRDQREEPYAGIKSEQEPPPSGCTGTRSPGCKPIRALHHDSTIY